MSRKFNSWVSVRQAVQDAWLVAGRAGPLVWLATSLWLAVLALAAGVLPSQYAGRARDQQALRQAQSAQAQVALQQVATPDMPAVSEIESSQRNAAQFRALLAQAPLPEGAQQTLFALAKRWNLELPQGQYQQSCDDSGAWCSYRMQLPVVGSYTAVRGFVQDALHALPSLALESAGFKREAVGTEGLEVALRWTLYQAPVPAVGVVP